MSLSFGRFVRIASACMLALMFVVPTQSFAQSHVVSPADLQKQVVASTNARQANLDTLSKTLASPKVENAMKAAKIDPAQVKTAMASLSDTELAQLTARANNAQSDFAGGNISDRDLLIILVGIAALILIIVAVH